MLAPTRISFVRHGEVDNPQAIHYGRLPGFGLSAEGRRQAQAAAQALGDPPIVAVYASPRLRARQTARQILSLRLEAGLHANTPLYISQHLDEVHNPFDGQPRSVLAARNWDVYTGTVPPYEQPADVLARTLRFVAEVRSRHAGQHVVAVTHGDVITFLLLWSARQPIGPQHKRAIANLGVPDAYPAPASITTLLYRTTGVDEHPSVKYVQPY
jgi:broad specificity phosphatase PhoE